MKIVEKKHDYSELINFFDGIELPLKPIRIYQCEVITDVKKFVENELNIIKTGKHGHIKDRCIERLTILKKLLTTGIIIERV